MKWKALQAFDFLKAADPALRVQQTDFFEKKYGFFSEFVEYVASDPLHGYVCFICLYLILLFIFSFFDL